ncbi:MAG: glycerol-3-phosphate acyltransferase [Caldisericia bacterium]
MKYIILPLISYLIGSFSWGVIITKYYKKNDIRGKDYPGGSGVSRQFGFKFGLLVGFLDALKGLSIFLIFYYFGKSNLILILSYIALILGNNYPLYFGFNGGQGVAATIGFFFPPFPFFVLLSISIGIFFIFFYNFFKLNRFIKFMGAVPFGTIFGLLTIFILLIRKFPFYPYPLLVIIASSLLLFRGLTLILSNKKQQ